MNNETLISLLTFGGTLLLVVTGLLNFSVFVRQLRAAREQLETARRQLESARQQPAMNPRSATRLRVADRGLTVASRALCAQAALGTPPRRNRATTKVERRDGMNSS